MRTIREVEKLTGITRRSLQEYDKYGLLSPTNKEEIEKGHLVPWEYDDYAINTLKLIQLYVEAGYKRKEIKAILADPDNILEEFEKLVSILEEKKRRIDKLINEVRLSSLASDIPRQILEPISKEIDKRVMQGEIDPNELKEARRSLDLSEFDETERELLKLLMVVEGLIYIQGTPSSEIVQTYIYNILVFYIETRAKLEGVECTDDFRKKEIQEYLNSEHNRGVFVDDIFFDDHEYMEAFENAYGKDKTLFVKEAFEYFRKNGMKRKSSSQ